MGVIKSRTKVTEEDGSPIISPHTIKFSNGTVTDNGDGTASVNTAAGAGDLLAANNLSDVADAATAFGNIKQPIAVSDLADGTDGQLITWDADGHPATVAAGTAGQVLTSNGAGAAPTFGAAGSGDLVAANNLSDVASAATSRTNLSIDDIATKKSKLDATVAPAVTNDVDEGYAVGSIWIDVTADKTYVCMDATDGAAVWQQVTLTAAQLTVIGNTSGTNSGNETNASISTILNAASADTLGDTDIVPFDDGAVKKITWANVKATLKTYFDSLTTTFTNKRITPRVGTVVSHATPTIDTDSVDCFSITAQAEDITSMTTNLSGTPTNFQKLTIRIKDDGTARAIAWGASFEDAGHPLPTTTVAGKLLTVTFLYNSVTSKWGCLSAVSES